MLALELFIFFQNPEVSGKRDLYPATVKSLNDKFYTVEFIEKELNLEAGSQVLIYYERSCKFVKQSAQVETVDETDPKQVIIVLKGEPVSAENRQCYRISTVVKGFKATFGSEENCPLNDVSITGFSVNASQPFKIGTLVDTTLRFEDESFSDTASVQSIKELDDSNIRYGLYCIVEASGANAELTRGLRNICFAIQREQMRRLAGNQ